MAIKQRSGAGPTLTAIVGLVLLFVGERLVQHGVGRTALSGIGALALLAGIGWRAAGPKTGAARLLLLAKIGCALAVAIYFAGSDDGVRVLKLHPGPHFQGALGALWPIVLGISLVPLGLAQWAAWVSRAPDDAPADVESFRVSESAANGLTIALAGAFLFLLCFIASERDAKVDVSYFRTAMPGSATVNMVSSLDEPLKVLLFFPDVNEVKDEVKTYFDELEAKTQRVVVESHDKELAPKLAKDMNVYRDGTVVLVHGTQHEAIPLDVKIEQARGSLKTLDQEVQKAFMKIARGSRTAYFTTGHGEMNMPPEQGVPQDPFAQANAIRDLMNILNYKTQDLGIQQGLAQDVPSDARIVFVLGPKKAFLDEELAALDRYIARGGAILIALDPNGEFKLGPLEQRLGVKFDPVGLADDHQFLARRNNPSDHKFLITDQFSTHASVTTLSHARAGSGLIAINPGSLDLAPGAGDEGGVKPTFVVRTLPSTFADANGDGLWQQGEERKNYNIVAAIEKPADNPDPNAKDTHPARAVVYATPALVADAVITNVNMNAALIADNVKWLGGEEQFTGETISEKDVEIQHTRSQDVAWFYSTIIGAPLLLLGGGLAATMRRRRGRRS